jgi:hypothetical protein
MQFTTEDEEHLCNWIATKIPYKETGGRTGNRLYQQLCELSTDPEYAWASRHTWQSWRERYKKNSARLDGLIAAVVDQKKPLPGEKGQYGYVRQPETKPRKTRRKRDDSHGKDDYEELIASTIPTTHNHTFSLSHDPQTLASSSSHVHTDGSFGPRPTDSSNTLQRGIPAEEEMEDDGPDWVVRIGNAQPPSWGKRKADAPVDEMDARKRLRT